MTGGLPGLVLLGLGWLLTGLVLGQSAEPAIFARVLGCLVLAECTSSLLLAMARTAAMQARTAGQDQAALASALGGWVILCGAVVLACQLGLAPLFAGQGFAVFCMLALSLGLTLLKLDQGAGVAQRSLLALRWVFAGLAMAGATRLAAPDSDQLLGVCLLSVLVLVLIRLCQRSGSGGTLPNGGQVGTVLSRYADVFAVPLLLGPAEAGGYLAARGLSLVVSAGLAQLGGQMQPVLQRSFRAGDPAGFVAKAARLNLGFLLIGGSLGLAVLAVGPYAALALPTDAVPFQSVLGWLLIGACAPVLFGATDAVLHSAGRQVVQTLTSVAAAVALWAFALGVPVQSATLLAQCFAAVQLIRAGVSAVYLARVGGIWPGLTALLLRQIKLF